MVSANPLQRFLAQFVTPRDQLPPQLAFRWAPDSGGSMRLVGTNMAGASPSGILAHTGKVFSPDEIAFASLTQQRVVQAASKGVGGYAAVQYVGTDGTVRQFNHLFAIPEGYVGK